MIIHASEVFTVDHDTKSIDTRSIHSFDIPELSARNQLINLSRTYLATSLSKNDFGLFVTAIDTSGATTESFLMNTYLGNSQGMIVPSDSVIEFPNKYLSAELARKINTLYPEEIEQFGLSSLIKAVKRQYPNIR